ncbi:SWIM zinc finger domain-containing protein [Aeromicrobium sp. UC242_57]|uniref:SWIM zinc finger domain-containing protein n=1 Tax=Aeromicrobium sp. UC242_57 TaxID=3374624 RepID=UPI0037921518
MPTTISALTDVELRRAFDSGAMTRGTGYGFMGRAAVHTIDPDEQFASATVTGSGTQVYFTSVQLSEDRHGETLISGSCTCPVAINCKHAVALIVELRRTQPRVAPAARADLPDDGWRQRLHATPTEPPWRSTLEPLVDRRDARTKTDWALQLDLEPSYYRGEALLSARPLKRGATGKWIKTGASWQSVQKQAAVSEASSQVSALAELQTAAGPDYSHRPRSDGTINLANLSRDAWRIFVRLADAGVTLIGPSRGEVTIITPALSVAVNVAPDDDGGLIVSASPSDVSITDAQAADRTMLLGQPVHGIVAWDDDYPSRLWLAPFDKPLDPSLVALVQSQRGVRVPPADVAEFMGDFYPQLKRTLGTVRVDPRITVPEISPPRLMVTVKHDGLAAEVIWGFQYDVNGESRQASWAHGREQFRDPGAEWDLVDSFVPPDGVPVTTDQRGRIQLVPHTRIDGYPAALFSEDVIPKLIADGIAVEVEGERPNYRLAKTAPVVHISLEDGKDPKSDWFDLAVTVTIEGEKVHFGPLFAALVSGESHLVLLSGTHFSLDRPEPSSCASSSRRPVSSPTAGAISCGSTAFTRASGTSSRRSASSSGSPAGGARQWVRWPRSTRSRALTCRPASSPICVPISVTGTPG